MNLTDKDYALIQAASYIIRKNYDNKNWWHTVGAAVRAKSGKVSSLNAQHSADKRTD